MNFNSDLTSQGLSARHFKPYGQKRLSQATEQKPHGRAVSALGRKGGKKPGKLYSPVPSAVFGISIKLDQCFLSGLSQEVTQLCPGPDTLVQNRHSRAEQFQSHDQAI